MELYLYELFKTKKQKVLFFILFFIPTFISLLLTFSRRSWGLFLVGVFIYYLFKKGNKILFLTSSMVIVFILFNFIDFESIINRFLLIFDNHYESNSARIDAFNLQYNVFVNNLFTVIGGNGVGMFGPSSIFTKLGQWSQIDNYYMQVLLEFGFFGLFLYILIFIIVFFYAIKLLKMVRFDIEKYNKVLIYLIILTSLYISAIVGSTPISFPLNTLQWIVIGLILKNYVEAKRILNK
jgi:O-antigen ligase